MADKVPGQSPEADLSAYLSARTGRARKAAVPLSVETAEQIKTAFYVPILTGTHLAESLLLAAGANADLMASAEWRSTMQQALEQIQAACTSLRAISLAQAPHETFTKILANVDEYERFLRLLTPLIRGIEPDIQQEQLTLTSHAFEKAQTGLKRLKKPVFGTAPKKTARPPQRRRARATRRAPDTDAPAPLRPG